MGNMSPEELEKQMKDAMQMLSSGDMMAGMMDMQDEIIKSLEESGQVSAEELAKYKADPEYFEQKMKESFGQMQDLFSDPETLKAATAGIQGLTDLYKNPEKLGEVFNSLLGDFDNDEKIEEVRQQLLESPDLGIPGLSEAFNTPEMKEMLSDPQKWREAVKEGKSLFGAAGAAGGTGVGEL
jgi:dsDNA-specific endonuclease/ATPase MutS2